ncbi:hypothetical protein Ahia01_000608300 [Argonauta hians]
MDDCELSRNNATDPSSFTSLNNYLPASNNTSPNTDPSRGSSHYINNVPTVHAAEELNDDRPPLVNQAPPIHYHRTHWLFTVCYLILCVLTFSCSIIHTLSEFRTIPQHPNEILTVILDLSIASLALIVFGAVLPFARGSVLSPSRNSVPCIVCASFKLLFGSILFGLQQSAILMAILIGSSLLLVLLCVPKLITDFVYRCL